MKKEREYYWSISLEPGYTQAAVWYIEDDLAQIQTIGPVVSWEEESQLINSADTTISSCISQLPRGVSEPSNTVFGVPPSWVTDGQINKNYLEPIREICQKLSLTPQGFVVFPEAISNYLKIKKDGATNIVVLGINQDEIDLSVFRLGNLNGTVTLPRTVSLVDDVNLALTKFGAKDPIPSRFVVYDGSNAASVDAVKVLSEASWGDQKPITFLHTPTFTAFSPNEKLVAVSLAGASEIAQVNNIIWEESDEKIPEEIIEDTKELSSVAVDFEETEDMEESDFDDGEHANLIEPKKHDLPGSNFIKKSGNMFKAKISVPSMPRIKIPNMKLGGFRADRSVVLFALLSTVFVALFVLWWFLPSADITLYVRPKKITSNANLTISPTVQTSITDALIQAREVKTSVSGNERVSATGVKTVGDPAKGSITIRNGTAVPIKLPAGVIVTSSGNLRFTLDNSASVSAALSPSQPGEVKVNATADAIGAESNLAKGELFKVSNYPKSEVDAISETDFTGGSSRQSKVVSKDDLKNLEQTLTNKLKDSAKVQLSSTFSDSDYLVPNSEKITVTNKKFDHQSGEEADTVSLDLSIDLTSLVISKNNIVEHARLVMEKMTPTGYVLRDSQIEYGFSEKPEISDKSYKFDVSYKANLLPNVSIDSIKEKITGKYVFVAQDYFSKSIAGFSKADIVLRPPLPGPLGTLPHKTNKIEITLSSE